MVGARLPLRRRAGHRSALEWLSLTARPGLGGRAIAWVAEAIARWDYWIADGVVGLT